jgi:hypothetical protein
MSDPAVEAARQAWPGRRKLVVNQPRFYMESAAREALKPIRTRHYRVPVDDNDAPVCASCWGPNGPRGWPCPDALDAYTTEELGHE